MLITYIFIHNIIILYNIHGHKRQSDDGQSIEDNILPY